jgi:restriction endonuclease S subunit
MRPPKAEARRCMSATDLVSFVPMSDLGEGRKLFEAREERTLAEVEGSYTYFANNDVLLAKITPCFENGKLGIARNLKNGIGFGSSEYFVLRPSAKLDSEFLYYFLAQDSFRDAGRRVMTGAVGHKRVPKEYLENLPFPLPPLPEQRRMVNILDEAFAGLEVLRANAEKNLKNARELFDGYLNTFFGQRGNGWVETTLGQEVSLLSGFAFQSDHYTNSTDGVKLLRGDNIIQGSLRWDDVKKWPASEAREFEAYQLQLGDIVLAMDRTWVKAGIKYAQLSTDDLPSLLVQRVARLRTADEAKTRLLFHLIGSRSFSDYVLSIQTGLGVPHISGKQIEAFRFYKPPKAAQHQIVTRIDRLASDVSRLESIACQKLAAVAELKQSVLQKAFAGELTSDTARSRVVVTKKNAEIETTSPEFAAHILAFSYSLHALQRREKSFGHVKAQKTLQLAESIGGIELGRKPIKDAAGPNDFPHMLKAEEWARSHRFFEFVKKDGGYDFRKLDCYDEMIAQYMASITPYRESLKKVVDLVLPMNSREAEVFATVHAAWNNLILDKATVTDEIIVREARDKWHPGKMTIPEGDFKKAIRSIRDKGLVPNGSAKRVGGQDMLF